MRERWPVFIGIALALGLLFVCIAVPLLGLGGLCSFVASLPTPAPTATYNPVGLTRANPARLGKPVVNDQEVECTVLGVERGIALEWESPEEGNEFIAITLRLRNLGSTDQTRRYAPSDFRVVGARGMIYDRMLFLSTLDDALGSGEFFGGAEVTGKIIQEAGIGETNLVLIWDPGPGSSARYLSLEK